MANSSQDISFRISFHLLHSTMIKSRFFDPQSFEKFAEVLFPETLNLLQSDTSASFPSISDQNHQYITNKTRFHQTPSHIDLLRQEIEVEVRTTSRAYSFLTKYSTLSNHIFSSLSESPHVDNSSNSISPLGFACISEMQSVYNCFRSNPFNHDRCSDSVQDYRSCIHRFLRSDFWFSLILYFRVLRLIVHSLYIMTYTVILYDIISTYSLP